MFRITAILLITGTIFGYWSKDPTGFPVDTERYPEHLTGAFTGGFGEETCHSCHFDYDLNWEEGNLSVTGIPGSIKPGNSYAIVISVEREDLGKAGFQISARYRDGSQAGFFEISGNERIMLTETAPDSLQYVQHSSSGVQPVEEEKNSWELSWNSPELRQDSVFFHIAANAANGDQSEFGDWIYMRKFAAKISE